MTKQSQPVTVDLHELLPTWTLRVRVNGLGQTKVRLWLTTWLLRLTSRICPLTLELQSPVEKELAAETCQSCRYWAPETANQYHSPRRCLALGGPLYRSNATNRCELWQTKN